jgi:hypothetical protein
MPPPPTTVNTTTVTSRPPTPSADLPLHQIVTLAITPAIQDSISIQGTVQISPSPQTPSSSSAAQSPPAAESPAAAPGSLDHLPVTRRLIAELPAGSPAAVRYSGQLSRPLANLGTPPAPSSSSRTSRYQVDATPRSITRRQKRVRREDYIPYAAPLLNILVYYNVLVLLFCCHLLLATFSG